MKNITRFLFLAVTLMFTAETMAQSTVTGTVIDAEMNAPLPSANIIENGTTNGVSSDFDGNFTITTLSSMGEVVISYVGYGTVTLSFNGDTNLGEITLTSDNSLDEIVIIGSGVIDLAEDRKTPVAVSTIKAEEIREKAGNFDLPVLLNICEKYDAYLYVDDAHGYGVLGTNGQGILEHYFPKLNRKLRPNSIVSFLEPSFASLPSIIMQENLLFLYEHLCLLYENL